MLVIFTIFHQGFSALKHYQYEIYLPKKGGVVVFGSVTVWLSNPSENNKILAFTIRITIDAYTVSDSCQLYSLDLALINKFNV